MEAAGLGYLGPLAPEHNTIGRPALAVIILCWPWYTRHDANRFVPALLRSSSRSLCCRSRLMRTYHRKLQGRSSLLG